MMWKMSSSGDTNGLFKKGTYGGRLNSASAFAPAADWNEEDEEEEDDDDDSQLELADRPESLLIVCDLEMEDADKCSVQCSHK